MIALISGIAGASVSLVVVISAVIRWSVNR